MRKLVTTVHRHPLVQVSLTKNSNYSALRKAANVIVTSMSDMSAAELKDETIKLYCLVMGRLNHSNYSAISVREEIDE